MKSKKKPTPKPKLPKHAKACVDYLLNHEYSDFFEYVGENDYAYKDWKKVPHIYVSALIAKGLTPNEEEWPKEEV